MDKEIIEICNFQKLGFGMQEGRLFLSKAGMICLTTLIRFIKSTFESVHVMYKDLEWINFGRISFIDAIFL